MTDLDTLLRSSDIVAMLVSITPSRGCLASASFALMKPSGVSGEHLRGEAIDEAALYRALREKRIAAPRSTARRRASAR